MYHCHKTIIHQNKHEPAFARELAICSPLHKDAADAAYVQLETLFLAARELPAIEPVTVNVLPLLLCFARPTPCGRAFFWTFQETGGRFARRQYDKKANE